MGCNMKVAFAAFVIILLGIFLVYQFGFKGFDPAQQAERLKADLKPGMTWQEVADLYPPKKVRLFAEGGEDSPARWTNPEKFDRAQWTSLMAKGTGPTMFAFQYVLSPAYIYDIHFDASGKMTHIEDIGEQYKEQRKMLGM